MEKRIISAGWDQENRWRLLTELFQPIILSTPTLNYQHLLKPFWIDLTLLRLFKFHEKQEKIRKFTLFFLSTWIF